MNIKKAQKDVFNQILNGAKAGFFHVDKNNVLVSADGYMGYIFPTKKIRFSLDGLREITPFPIAELVKPENRMAPTENYRTTQHGMCRWMKHANGNYVLVQNKFLSCFTGAEFYSEGYNISMIVAAEGDIPVGIILPIRSSYVPDAELLESEG